MAHVPPGVHALFRQQHGVATTEQLRQHGMTRGNVDTLVSRGDLLSMMRGVVRSPSVAETEMTRCAAVSLAHPLVAVSGPTAGRLWNFRRVPPDRRIHVLAPRHWRATTESWCVAYRTDAQRQEDVIVRSDGIRVTTPQRTALDLARSISDPDHLLSIIEQAAHDGGLRDGDLRAVAVDWAHRRTWVARFLVQLDRRLDGPAAESEPEVRVGTALERAGVIGLRRQWPLHLPGFGSIRFDLAVPAHRWAIEVDVFPTHRETVGHRHDEQRDAATAAAGWTVRRISEVGYRNDFDGVIAHLAGDFARLRRAA